MKNEDFREWQADLSVLLEDCGNTSTKSGSCLVYVNALIENVLWDLRKNALEKTMQTDLKDSSGCQRHRTIFDYGKLSLFYSNVSANTTV